MTATVRVAGVDRIWTYRMTSELFDRADAATATRIAHQGDVAIKLESGWVYLLPRNNAKISRNRRNAE